MSTRIEITEPGGNIRAIESLRNIAASTDFGVQKALWQSGKDLEGIFKRQVLSKNKTGRLYIRRDRAGRGRRHIASAPGETPANRTGFYRKSVGFNVNGAHQLTFGNSAEYAGFLEVGTLRMKARPGLLNAINAGQRDIMRNLTTEIEDEI